MDIFVWATIVLGIWAALGPLLGVYYGQFLAKEWNKEQWIRDNRKQECRELLEAIYACPPDRPANPEEFKSESRALHALVSRVFIADDIAALETGRQFQTIRQEYQRGHLTPQEFRHRREEVTQPIRNLALG